MFQAGSRYREVQCRLKIIPVGQQSVDQSSHEGVTTANPVDDVGDLVSRSLVEFLSVVKNTAPGIVIGTDRTSQGGDHLFAARAAASWRSVDGCSRQ